GLSIDPNTGLLTGKPTVIGQFVVGVCVEEWSDGVFMGTHTRDFQFNVAPCEQTSSAIIEPIAEDQYCDDLTFHFTNLSNPDNDFCWDLGDPPTNTDNAVTFNAQSTYPDTGTYTVTLITNPGFFCSDTAEIILPVYVDAFVDIDSFSFECQGDVPVYS